MGVDWSVFKSKYFQPEPGSEHHLILRDWHIEEAEFTDDNGRQKRYPKLVFTISFLDGVAQSKDLYFSTGSLKLIEQFRKYIEAAENQHRTQINIILIRQTKRNYVAIDADIVQKAVYS